MGMLWRRKSSVLKVVIAVAALWFTIVFFFYSDDRAGNNSMLPQSPSQLQQQEADAKEFNRHKFKDFIVNSYKDAQNGIKKVVNINNNHIENDEDLKNRVEVDESEMFNEIVGEREEEEQQLMEEVKEKAKTPAAKIPSRKRLGQKKDDSIGFLMPPNELGLESPGELGKPVTLPTNMSVSMKKAVDDGWLNNAFNQYVSDMISVRRSLPDPRTAYCKDSVSYLEDLPATSVIVCFHNEAWSVLLRTVHSIIDRSPEHLLKEIILVDDFSDMRKYSLSIKFTIILMIFYQQHIPRSN